MASWKKVIVSGSNISQLTNDAGYVASIGGGLLSGSAEGDAQGQVKLNGINVDINALGTNDSPTFVTVTADLVGNVTGNADSADTASYVAFSDIDGEIIATTASYVAVGDIDGEIVATTASYVAAAFNDASISDDTITITDFAGNETDLVVNNVVVARTASYVEFAGVNGLTAFSSSVASQITDTAFDLTFAADGGTDDVIADGDTVTFAGGTNITSAVTDGQIEFALDADISLTSVTASVKGDVVGNVTGNVTGDVTGDLTGTADTASYVAVEDIDGEITAVTASHVAASSTGQGLVSIGDQTDIDLGLKTDATVTFDSLTLTGDLTVQGTTTAIDTANLEVKDQFISINDGGGAADAGLVVDGVGASFGWDNSEERWAFDAAGATKGQSTIGADAYAAAVVTSDDAKYQKNGNIRVESGDIFIYVE
jgi:hypothetical protein